MEALFDGSLTSGMMILLFLSLAIACGFEFVNGFHDTANAVATVIYTKSLKPVPSVVWSGIWNFLGVFLGGIAVAIGIINLLPVDLLVSSGTGAGMAMVLALLIGAVIWNVGTWYFGIPASSSHTLIGSILGVGLANSLLPGHIFGSGVNWSKAGEIGLSLLISPLIGFTLAALLLLLLKRLARNPKLHQAPEGDTPPPWWVRAILIFTCTGVSFAHGSNDGQKGVGLVMLILIGILPASYALNMDCSREQLTETLAASRELEEWVQHEMTAALIMPASLMASPVQQEKQSLFRTLKDNLRVVQAKLAGKSSVVEIPKEERFEIRKRILLITNAFSKLEKEKQLALPEEVLLSLKARLKALRNITEYAPTWVIVAIALSLGIGTMIGWKRIVVTVGEKIGKSHLTYSQGAAAEIVAMSTIGLSSLLGLPVSTTHVLSSGVAGTMVAQKAGIQVDVVRKIALAWLLTLPVSMLLAGTLFLMFRAILG
ncbi:MAG: inorganic phosphate transporter [Chloroherpetonaceae bacterium]|nr:inorganic phosphate transporter [Chloroherpetonaceae bacterium]MCS7212194.1 inorganic phosphate transporter [Chloroherpetonaceae bacterium]MDW8018806.1 inorganic phosphate transporter [Chloroherpetonaceae bacterium]MDW8467243.1 inorganic phosphate transporter [Chloroherpetonaceae bacterium]